MHVRDQVVDGQTMFHYASGGFLGASQASVGDLYASMAEVHGSLLAPGGAVFGSQLGTELKLDGLLGSYIVRYDQVEVCFLVGYEQKFCMGLTDGGVAGATQVAVGRMLGTWYADAGFNFRRSTAEEAGLSLLNSQTEDVESQKARITFDGTTMRIRVKGTQVLSADPNSVSTLHGSWVSERIMTVSDRRLKKNIQNLLPPTGPSEDGTPDRQGKRLLQRGSPSWILRQLRPVSFKFRDVQWKEGGAETTRSMPVSPNTRFGFIADEVQRVVPDLVETINYANKEDIKAVAYQDLVALIIAAQTEHEFKQEATAAQLTKRIEMLEQHLRERDQRVEERFARMEGLRDSDVSAAKDSKERLTRLERLFLVRAGSAKSREEALSAAVALCFDHFDKDGTGTLDRTEAGKALAMVGKLIGFDLSKFRMDSSFKVCDLNLDGQLDDREFDKLIDKVVAVAGPLSDNAGGVIDTGRV